VSKQEQRVSRKSDSQRLAASTHECLLSTASCASRFFTICNRSSENIRKTHFLWSGCSRMANRMANNNDIGKDIILPNYDWNRLHGRAVCYVSLAAREYAKNSFQLNELVEISKHWRQGKLTPHVCSKGCRADPLSFKQACRVHSAVAAKIKTGENPTKVFDVAPIVVAGLEVRPEYLKLFFDEKIQGFSPLNPNLRSMLGERTIENFKSKSRLTAHVAKIVSDEYRSAYNNHYKDKDGKFIVECPEFVRKFLEQDDARQTFTTRITKKVKNPTIIDGEDLEPAPLGWMDWNF